MLSRSPLTGERIDDVTETMNGTFSGNGTLSYEGTTLTISMQAWQINMTAISYLNLSSRIFQTITTVVFQGAMVLTVREWSHGLGP